MVAAKLKSRSKNGSTTAPAVGEPAFRSLIRTIGLLRRVMEPYFARHGISAAQWAVLRHLRRAEEEEGRVGLRATDLSDRLLVRPPSVSGVIDRLQRTGLVTRATSDADQRAKVVALTDPGRRLVARVREGHARRVQRVLAALSATERRELNRLLDRLGDHLEFLVEADAAEVAPAARSDV